MATIVANGFSMKHYLTFKDDKSDKFWQIEVAGNSFTVTYGRTGSSATSQVKSFDSEAACLKEAQKLLKEKLKKGYQEGKVRADYLTEWESMVIGKDRQRALENHFSYLAETTSAKQLLYAILKEVVDVQGDLEHLKIIFRQFELVGTPPDLSISKAYPKSFQNIFKNHRTLTISEHFTSLGDHRKFDLADGWFDDVDEDDEQLYVFAKSKHIVCPISEGISGNFWIYHPKEKNASGEPTIYYLEHDGMVIKNPQEGNAGDVFINCIANLLDITVEDGSTKFQGTAEEWWNALGKEWQHVFEESLWKKMEAGFSKEKVKKIKALDRITIPMGVTLANLDPLLALPNLKSLRIYTPNIKAYDALSQLRKLKEFEIHAGVYPVALLQPLVNLEKLELHGDHIESIDELNSLTRLKEFALHARNLASVDTVVNYPRLELLYIGETKVSDISVLTNLNALTHIELPSTVTAIGHLKDLRNLYYLNARACTIPLGEMVDFFDYRKDGFDLLTYNYWELLHETYRHNLEGIEDKVSSWFLRWNIMANRLGDRSILILLALYYFLENANQLPKKVKDLDHVKKFLEKKLSKVAGDSIEFLHHELLGCFDAARVQEARSLIKVLSELAENSPDVKILVHDQQKATLAKAVESAQKDLLRLVYNRNNRFLKAGKLAESKKEVLRFAADFSSLESAKLMLAGVEMKGTHSRKEMNFLESFASDVVVLSVMAKDTEVEKLAMALLPEKITDAELAFNLSCLYSIKRDKPQLLGYARIAKELGKTKEQFLADSDFNFYKDDPDFISAIG